MTKIVTAGSSAAWCVTAGQGKGQPEADKDSMDKLGLPWIITVARITILIHP